jgi:hypothetical protein
MGAVGDYSAFRVRNLGPSQAKILAVLGRLKLPFAVSPFRPFAVSLPPSFRHLRREMFQKDLGFDR